jgi:hypothetical protein
MPLLNYGEPSNSIRNLKRDSPARCLFRFLTYMDRPRPENEPLLNIKLIFQKF